MNGIIVYDVTYSDGREVCVGGRDEPEARKLAEQASVSGAEIVSIGERPPGRLHPKDDIRAPIYLGHYRKPGGDA